MNPHLSRHLKLLRPLHDPHLCLFVGILIFSIILFLTLGPGGLLQALRTQNQVDIFVISAPVAPLICDQQSPYRFFKHPNAQSHMLTLSTSRSSLAHSRISFLLSSRLRSVRRSVVSGSLLLLPSFGSSSPPPC